MVKLLKYNFTKFLRMLGHDLEMACTKFHKKRFRIDRETRPIQSKKQISQPTAMKTREPFLLDGNVTDVHCRRPQVTKVTSDIKEELCCIFHLRSRDPAVI